MRKYIGNIFFTLCFLAYTLFSFGVHPFKSEYMENKNFYCEYCGHKFPSVRLLTSGTCPRHPDGANKGRHKLYEGTEKREYTCKYCGHKFSSILLMTSGTCANNPKGAHKGSHAPALLNAW